MKNTQSQLLSTLFALVIAAVLLLPGGAAYAADITSLAATITLPVVGEEPDPRGYPGDNSKYGVQVVRFYDGDYELTHSSGDVFEAGKTYRIEVTLTPRDGYTLTALMATINGSQTAAFTGNAPWPAGAKKYSFYYSLAADVTSLAATITLPLPDEKPNATGIPGDSAKYTISSVKFFDFHNGDKELNGAHGDVFKAGKTYRIEITFAPRNGYALNTLMATVNGAHTASYAGNAEAPAGAKKYSFTYTLTNTVLTGNVRIAGGAKHYGDLLKPEYSGDIAAIPVSNLRFEWQQSDNKTTWTNISGATQETYQTPATGSVITYVRVRVTANGYDGAVYSDIRAVNPASVTDTFTGTVTIVQDHASEAHFVIGRPITAIARNTLGNEMMMDGMMYRWQRRADTDAPWEYISGATAKTYTPGNDDENCFLRVEVSYRQTLGELYSSSKWVDWRDVTYTVSFDLQGHGDPIAARTVQRGYGVTRPTDPRADGFTFGGWYTDAACTNAYDFNARVLGNVKLYADWTESDVFVMTGSGISADVRRNAGNYLLDDITATYTWKNGKAPGPSAVDAYCSHIHKDAALTDKLHEDPVPGGVYYAEFKLDNSVRYDRSLDFSNLTNDDCYFFIPGYTVTCEDITVDIDGMGYSYARFLLQLAKAPVYHTVTFDGNGHGTPPAPAMVKDGDPVSCPADPVANPGWKFAGWCEDQGGTQAYQFSTPITQDTTIYASWIKDVPITYTVTFDANGHGTAPAALIIENGKTATKPADPTANGWKFGGWYKEAACTNPFDFTTPITGDIKLYAKWSQEITYTLTYETNGGSGIPDTKHAANATVELTGTSSRGGHVFTGWYADAALTNKITSIKMDGDKTVYAGWKKIFYTDVPNNVWYKEAVDFVTEKGLMNGMSEDKFSPFASTSRAMIVTILYRLEGTPTVTGTNPFGDVANDKWYTDAILWANKNNIVEGYGNGKFGPDDFITREQFAAIMFRYANFKSYNTSKRADLSVYSDVSAVHDWALTAMKWANAESLISGRTETTLVPRDTATRAEAATILKRFIENIK